MATDLQDHAAAAKLGLALAWFTIAWNVVEGVAAVAFGVSEGSLALLGFGVDSWVEVASAGVVLWRLRGETGRGPGLATDREERATWWIGVLLLVLAGGIAVGAVVQIATGSRPDTGLPGLVIGAASLSFMWALWRAKLSVAHRLDSRTMLADAACSRSCIQLSVVLLAGSLIYLVAPALWWVDSVAALGLAWLVAREGRESIEASKRGESGCCGC